METEDSRHSKNNTEPRTIDLGAEEVRDIPQTEAEGADEDTRATMDSDVSSDSASTPLEDERPVAEDVAIPPHVPQKPQRNTSLMAASLIGGIVALAGAAGLQYWGMLPNLGSDEKVSVAITGLSNEVEGLKGNLAALASEERKVDLTPIDAKIKALETRLQDVPKANGLSIDADQRISALNEQVTTLSSQIEASRKQDADAQAQLVMRLEALEKKANEPGDDVEVAIAIASAGLKAAIDRGGPFTSELDTLAGVSPSDPAIASLKPFAEAGVPSRSKLVTSFPPTADLMLAALRKDDPNQSLTDRLLSSAFSAVKVRPVGNVEGESPDAVIARIEDRLTNGDFKAAQTEWKKLPDEAKKAGADYKSSLDARIKVEELVGSTLTRAVQGTESKG